MKTVVVLALAAIILAGCENPPCKNADAAAKAAEAYRQCLLIVQRGDGGVGCGERAYQTFCKP